jgi:hypothetical protein
VWTNNLSVGRLLKLNKLVRQDAYKFVSFGRVYLLGLNPSALNVIEFLLLKLGLVGTL